MQIVLYSDDINLLDYWEKNIERRCDIIYEAEDLYQVQSSLVMINYSVCQPTCKSVIQKLVNNENRVFVLHRMPSLEMAKEILRNGAMGYGNALMRKHFLLSAINTIEDDMVWLHPEFTSRLILQIDTKIEIDHEIYLEKLSDREREVATLLKDGYTYNDIALMLNVTPRTIKAHAQHIYVKLNVKDRLALAVLLR